jgi:ankyrin repeat protein
MKKIFLLIVLLGFITGCSCSSSSVDYKQILLEEHEMEFTDENFFSSVVANNYEVVELFLQGGKDPDIEFNGNQRALSVAISFNAIETIKLLAEYGADVGYIDEYGIGYMYFASINGQSCETLKTLVDVGADLYHLNSSGDSALAPLISQRDQYGTDYEEQITCLNELGLTE